MIRLSAWRPMPTAKRADEEEKRARGMAMGKQPKRDYSDKTRIDLNQPYQVAYWKQRFGVSDQELEDAVQAVGTLVEKIEAYLESKGLCRTRWRVEPDESS
jgi:hypothetical protein